MSTRGDTHLHWSARPPRQRAALVRGDCRSGGKRTRCIQSGPGGPATSIVFPRIAPNRQGPAPYTSSASASTAWTALVNGGGKEAYVGGISTRSVDELVAALGIGSGIKKSDVRVATVQEFTQALLDHCSSNQVRPEHGDAHEYHPYVGDAAQKSGSTSHLHELAHDDPDIDQGKADGAHRYHRACRRDSLMRGLMIDPQVAQLVAT